MRGKLCVYENENWKKRNLEENKNKYNNVSFLWILTYKNQIFVFIYFDSFVVCLLRNFNISPTLPTLC